jgi:hypothetical protein
MNLLQQNKHLEDSRFGKLSAKQTLIRFSHSKSSYTQKEKVFNVKKSVGCVLVFSLRVLLRPLWHRHIDNWIAGKAEMVSQKRQKELSAYSENFLKLTTLLVRFQIFKHCCKFFFFLLPGNSFSPNNWLSKHWDVFSRSAINKLLGAKPKTKKSRKRVKSYSRVMEVSWSILIRQTSSAFWGNCFTV